MDEFVPCGVCRRNPLIGEEIAVMTAEGGDSAVCAHCLQSPRAGALGELSRLERVRSAAGAANVRRAWPKPAEAPFRVAAPSPA